MTGVTADYHCQSRIPKPAGGFSATLYALHCVDDSPLFVAAWYGLGTGLVAAAGAALGPKVLKW